MKHQESVYYLARVCWQTSFIVLMLVVCILFVTDVPVQALSSEQRRVIDSGARYFNIAEDPLCEAGSAGGTQLVGGDNVEITWSFLMGKGLTAIQTAGAMGNLRHEGGFNPRRVEDGWGYPREMDSIPPKDGPQGQPGYGIVQWTSPGRKDGLQAMADERGLPVYDLGLQLDYMWSELEGPYKERALDPLMQATDLETAVRIWQDKYEVGTNFEKRMTAAVDFLATYGSVTGGTNPTSDTIACADGPGGGSSGAVVGGYSLPLDRHWYDEHPDWFTKTHHSGRPAIDIPVPTGTPVYSMTAGRVILAPNGTATEGCGFGLEIEAPDGVRYIYCHGTDGGSVDGARQGDEVQAGQLIMHSASTGSSTGPHLHVGIRINGVAHCPQNLLVGIAQGSPPDVFSLPSSGCTH